MTDEAKTRAEIQVKDEIIQQLVAALKEFMDVWSSGDATKVGQRAMKRRAEMWDKAKAALDAAKGVGL